MWWCSEGRKWRWHHGYAKHLGTATAFIVELWGVYEGLRLAKQLGVTKLEVQLDSTSVVQSIMRIGVGSASGYMLLTKIKDLLLLDWDVRVKHICKEGNRSADILANLGCDSSTHYLLFDRVSACLSQVFYDNARGVSIPRLVSA